MNHSHHEVLIGAPVAQVWEFFLDTSRWSDWMPQTTISEISGPIDQVGTTYREVDRVLGFEMKSTATVVEVEPLRLYHDRTEPGPMETRIRFEPEGETTRLVFDADWEMPGHLPGFLKDLMAKGWGDRQAQHLLEGFKALVEAKVPARV